MKTSSTTQRPSFNQKIANHCSVLVAAGRGYRAGGEIPKQYQMFRNEPVFLHSLKTLQSHPTCEGVVIIHPAGDEEIIYNMIRKAGLSTVENIALKEGGSERAESVAIGLKTAFSFQADAVLIHDAARPGLRHEDMNKLLDALKTHDGAAPALPVADALKHWDNDVVSSVSRDHIYRIQTPQAFRSETAGKILNNSQASDLDEFETANRLAATLTLTNGGEHLRKITYPEDFRILERLMMKEETRIGSGYDVHAFEKGDGVYLCGTKITHKFKLKGHSDADVAWHALTDAIFGALGEGDIGDHFPPSDPQWKGAESIIFLEFAAERVAKRHGRISNVDLTLICEAPKIKPHREVMRQRTAEVLNISADRVSVKATTTEGLGFEGRREGIAAQAVVSIVLPQE